MQHGILLVGHGTRDSRGIGELLSVATQLAARFPERRVEPCFLELATPNIREGVRRLAEAGVSHFAVLPALLFAAGHANQDIPQAVEQAVDDWQSESGQRLGWRQAAHLGCHPAILELSRRRFRQAVAEMSLTPDRPIPFATNQFLAVRAPHSLEMISEAGEAAAVTKSSVLVLVGRGSRDASATREMLDFSALRAADGGVAVVETCFLAMAEPRLEATLQRIAAGTNGRGENNCVASAGSLASQVIVQPHLLFSGALVSEVRETVERMAARFPDGQWIVVEPLGPDSQVIDALSSRLTALDGECFPRTTSVSANPHNANRQSEPA